MRARILDKLQTAVTKYDTKVVIISNLAQLFLDKDIPKKEAKELFKHLTARALFINT